MVSTFFTLGCTVIAGYKIGILISGCRSIWVFFVDGFYFHVWCWILPLLL